MLKRSLALAALLPLAVMPAAAQTRARAEMMDGKRTMMVTLPDGSMRRIYLDARTCEELADKTDCSMSTSMTPPRTPRTSPAPTTQAQMPASTPATPSRQTNMPAGNTVAAVAMSDPRFSTLVAAVQAAGLAEALMGEGPFTVFAPTNEAFAALGSTVTDLLKPENRDQLRTLLMYHVISGSKLTSRELNNRAGSTTGATEQTMGGPLNVSAAQGGYMIGGATVTSGDVNASNGVIHVIDRVIIPPSMEGRVRNN